MQKQAPTIARLLTIAVFTLSCFGLLTFLWLSFGGAVPLQPHGYRFHVQFATAGQLAQQADVRISGVPVGKVVAVKRSASLTDATVQLEPRFAPLPTDATAVLRQKSLLGETYLELSPGTRQASKIREGGTLGRGQVQSTAALDQILTAFDPKTRADLQKWMKYTDSALKGRSLDVNQAFGNLAPTIQGASSLLGILDAEHNAVRRLVHDSGVVFDTVGRRQAEVRTLIRSGEQLFQSTALRNRELAATIRALPPFMRQLTPALVQAEHTAGILDPSVKALLPVAPKLTPVLGDLAKLAPSLRSTFTKLDPVLSVANSGLPALSRTLSAARPVFDALDPFVRTLAPATQYIDLYKQELISMWAKTGASVNYTLPSAISGKPTHLLRALLPINGEVLATQGTRLGSSRHNAYDAPRSLDKLASNKLESLDCQNAGNLSLPALGAAPPCIAQAPLDFRGKVQSYPNLTPDPPQ